MAAVERAEPVVAAVAEPGSAGPLVVRIRNWIGDVVLGLPALELLQAHGYELNLVARGGWAPTLLAEYGWPVAVQPRPVAERVRQFRDMRWRMRQRDPGFDRRDNALLFPVSLSSALEMRLAGLRAVGFAKEGRTPLLARSLPQPQTGHELTRYWKLACGFLRLQLEPPPDIGMRVSASKLEEARARLGSHGIDGRYVLICPFAAGLAATARKGNKKWPGFPDFVARAEAELGVPVVVYPGPGEEAEARERYPAALAPGGGDLGLYLALMKGAALVIANDTGPGHMAGAVGIPVFSILGPTIAARWGPYGRNVRVLQHAHPEAEDAVDAWPSVDEVLSAAAAVLAQR